MEYFEVKCPVDIPAEEREIINYLHENWSVHTSKANLEELVQEILEKGILRGIHNEEHVAVWYALCRTVTSKSLSASNPKSLETFQPIETLDILTKSEKEIDFSEYVETLHDSLIAKFAYIFAEPKNYSKRAYQKQKQEHKPEFHGMPLHPVACKEWPSFQEIMSIENVKKYDDIGLSPLKTMIGTILRQGFSIGAYWVDARLGWIYPALAKNPPKQYQKS